ncbi:MAG TPA: hypothetical protein VFO73_11075 [Candidatus Limnocylindrales bacterium]|nr:hypothetical protein [Candidatus Limnocylindrales bacterium]
MLVRWFSSTTALWVVGVWAMAEASLFFVVPDLWLGLVALFAPRRVGWALVAIALGAIVGAVVLTALTVANPSGLSDLIGSLPGTAPADLARARDELDSGGLVAFLNGPVQGLPVKVYIHEASQLGLSTPFTLVFTALNRIERIGLFGLVMALVGFAARGLMLRFPRTAVAGYLVAWIIFYVGYWSARPG